MPIYEYHCPNCDQRFDRLQKVDAPREIECTQCHAETATRVTSMPSFRLKGTGWYETDFKTSNQRHLAGDAAKPKESVSTSNDVKKTSSSSSEKSTKKSSTQSA